MATASTAHPALVNARAPSQFSQYHLTQFMVNAQTNAKTTSTIATDAYPTSTNVSSNPSGIEAMAQITRPPSGETQIERPRALSQEQHHPNSSPHMGLLEIVERSSSLNNTTIEGVLGPNKDGRVRNPVPSKLKGKTDNSQGNFGVMHMGQSPGKKTEAQARDNAAERDAAARRTSENTASRAKAAQQDKYMPPKKRGLEASLNDHPGNRGSPFAVSKNDDRNRARPLAPDETKFEQARLLTLLRSINPVTVVDQICKAVAYFGGIPGAPPPEDGIFPESANTRETGALFIGWVAEIFPDLSSRSPEVHTKATQAGRKKSRPSTVAKKESVAGETEAPNSRNGYGYGPAISAPAWGLPPSLALVNTPIPVPAAVDGNQGIPPGFEQHKPMDQLSDSAMRGSQEDTNDSASTSKRRRGRPKGSRNKGGKGDGDLEPGSNNSEQQAHQSPELSSNASATNNSVPPGFGILNQQPNMQKATQSYQYPAQSWSNSQKSLAGPNVAAPVDDQLSPEERAVLEAFRHQGADTSNPPPPVPVKSTAGSTLPNEKKRKRAPAKPKANVAPVKPVPVANPPAEYGQGTQNTPILPPTNTASLGQSHDPVQWSSAAAPTPILPPAKKPRVRKPKAPVPAEAPARNQSASVVSNATPPISTSTIPEMQAAVPQQSQPVSRPPAEGLEAHYERFANLQQTSLQQQNGRSNTPTIQQQPRQQSKPASVPPQQSTPQLQHQQLQHHQMQQQKSQQGQQGSQQQSLQQKDDQKVSQTASSSSSRPSSTTYYNTQRSQPTTFNQQYPTHQPSQLYAGHQASPQLSNNSTATPTTNSNSNYNNRTYNSHSLAQASPQFSQSEASYRTASPHTIAQPSPSFSQTESGFRANSHNITQPTATYSQPENSYRTPTTHAMAQPAASYASARTHTQPQASHQSHYNHFSDSSFIDLPTLESLGHTGNSVGSGGVSMGVGGYGQGLGVGQGTSRATGGSNSLYGTSSGLSNAFDTNTSDILRGVSRTGGNSNPGYGSGPSGLGSFDTAATSEHELRERLLRGLGRR